LKGTFADFLEQQTLRKSYGVEPRGDRKGRGRNTESGP